MLETVPTNTKTLPQLPPASVLDELFENGADMRAVETCFNELLVSCDHIRPGWRAKVTTVTIAGNNGRTEILACTLLVGAALV